MTFTKDKTQINELTTVRYSLDLLKKKTTNLMILLRKCEPILVDIQKIHGHNPFYPDGTLGFIICKKSKELLTEIEKLKEIDLLTEIENIKKNEKEKLYN